jgi:hypothetical protein
MSEAERVLLTIIDAVRNGHTVTLAPDRTGEVTVIFDDHHTHVTGNGSYHTLVEKINQFLGRQLD